VGILIVDKRSILWCTPQQLQQFLLGQILQFLTTDILDWFRNVRLIALEALTMM
jgi:hypothetical protein